MSDADLLTTTATRIFADHCTPERNDEVAQIGWDSTLWDVLHRSGLTELSLVEGTLNDAAVVIGLAGFHNAMVPLGETMVVGGWLARTIDLPTDGPVTAGRIGERIAFGRCAQVLLVSAEGEVTAGEVDQLGANLAHEPRDLMRPRGPVLGQVDDTAQRELAARAALVRTIQIAGAAERALDLTVTYVKERVAFGRTLSAFQAVQQSVAVMAAEVAVIRACSDAAVAACESGAFLAGEFAVAAAKTQASAAAGAVARIAHQMHGAIGFTYEHSLRLSTTRLWSWRDEAGNEAAWSGLVGERARTAGGVGLWPLIVGS